MIPPEDAGARGRPRIPSVSDLVAVVARDTNTAPERRPEIFRAAQQVCAEELRMVRTGFAPASLPELAARVVRLLPPDLGGNRYPGWSWDEEPPFPEEPLEEAPSPRFDPGDPFGGEDAWRAAAAAAGEAGGNVAGQASGDAAGDAAGDAGEASGDAPEFSTYPDAVAPEPAETEAGPGAGEASMDSAEEAEPEVEFAVVEDRPPASGGKLAAFLLVVAIAGGVWFFARGKKVTEGRGGASAVPETLPATTTASGSEVEAPVPPPGAPGRGPATSASGAAPNPAPPTPPRPAIPESRGASMITPDWAGRAPAYMIHFSSFQKKENADRDAARLAKVLGRPLHVVSVSLGAQGIWYRVMLGDFGSREEADAARAELAAKGTEGLGYVYRVSAP